MDFSLFDWTIYWFMFPVAMCVAMAWIEIRNTFFL